MSKELSHEAFFRLEECEVITFFSCIFCGRQASDFHTKICSDCVQTLSQIIKEKRDENKHGE